MLNPGDKVPAFSLHNQLGEVVTDAIFIGRKTILYFYPKDSTPGCTAEACNLRDNFHRLKQAGYQIIGVSKDSERSHLNFQSTYDLPFMLLSDPTTEMIQAYESWGEKTRYGHTSIGTLRRTMLIDEEGRIIRIIEDVNTKKHTAQILDND